MVTVFGLVYNLVYKGCDALPEPAKNQEIVSSVASSMRKWDSESPPMMIYMLEHQYCEASLSFQWLKNKDRAVANVLVQAK